MGTNLKLAGVIAVAAGVLVAAWTFNVQEGLRQTLTWIDGQGAAGAVVFGVLYVLACVLLIPGSVLTLGAGFLYGVAKGTILISIASTLGATAAFLVGRYLARDWVAGKIANHPKFAAIDEAVGREGWKIVGLTRLSPAFPFVLLNYAYGLTRVSLRDYFFASWLGMLPGTVLFVYLGSLAGSLATLGSGSGDRTPAQWTGYGVGLLATLAVTVYATRLARRALAKKV